MKAGDLIRPKRSPACHAVVLDTVSQFINRIRVLVTGSSKPEMIDPRMWEVVSESRRCGTT